MRVSNLGIKNNFINTVRDNYSNMKKVETQLATGTKINRPSDDPMAAVNSVYNKTLLRRIDQHKDNTTMANGLIDEAHDQIGSAATILQRVRELAVQSANGVYDDENRIQVATEVEELLKEIVSTANGKYKDDYLFAGGASRTKPFEVSLTKKEGISKPIVSSVEYKGNDSIYNIEVDDNDKVALNLNGGDAFWGGTHTIVALKDSRNFVATADQTIQIDGKSVEITIGDNLEAVVEKINNEVPSVHSFVQELPDGRKVFALESNHQHKIFADDLNGGTVLKDLGLIREDGVGTGNNFHPNTMESRQSLFDVVIRFRDSLLENNVEKIGGRDLGSIDTALSGMLSKQAGFSAIQSRLEIVERKLARSEELATERLSKNEDVDIARASLEFNQLANVHKVSLMTAAKMNSTTLLDYVR